MVVAIKMVIVGWKGEGETDLREGALGEDTKMIVSKEVYGDRLQSVEKQQPRT